MLCYYIPHIVLWISVAFAGCDWFNPNPVNVLIGWWIQIIRFIYVGATVLVCRYWCLLFWLKVQKWIIDPVLLWNNKLVTSKLHTCTNLKQQQWNWTRIMPVLDWLSQGRNASNQCLIPQLIETTISGTICCTFSTISLCYCIIVDEIEYVIT